MIKKNTSKSSINLILKQNDPVLNEVKINKLNLDDSISSSVSNSKSTKLSYKPWSLHGWLKGVNKAKSEKVYNFMDKSPSSDLTKTFQLLKNENTDTTTRVAPKQDKQEKQEKKETVNKDSEPAEKSAISPISPRISLCDKDKIKIRNYLTSPSRPFSSSVDAQSESAKKTDTTSLRISRTPLLEKFLNQNRHKTKNTDRELNCCDSVASSPQETASISSISSSQSSPKVQQAYRGISSMYRSESVLCKSPTDKILEFFEHKSSEWKKYPNILVDTHCHFDMLFAKCVVYVLRIFFFFLLIYVLYQD
jgi:hypothetical protein